MAKRKKKPYKFNQNSLIRGAIRRVFVRSPQLQETLKKGRKDEVAHNKDGSVSKKKDVYYKCAVCGKWCKRKRISVDHIVPVVDPDVGFVDWNTFVDRLFCSAENLQILCDDCHTEKTKKERAIKKIRENREKVV